MTIKDVYDLIDSFAPFASQESWDNSGIQIGAPDLPVGGVVICLDVTPRVTEICKEKGADLIVSHHPLLFHPLRRIDPDSVSAHLIRAGINVMSAHTNFDKAPGGVNDMLCETLCLPFKKLPPPTANGFLNIMESPTPIKEDAFASLLRDRLTANAVFYPLGKKVKRIAVCAGAGDDFAEEALQAGCDAYLTGEAHYHRYLDFAAAGVTMFTAGHYETEVHALPMLENRLRAAFPGLPVMTADRPRRLFTYV